MVTPRRFTQVDVFTERGTLGNPVAVVHDSTALDTEEMLRFTAWTNLSEATFVAPPTDPVADYAVRIFTGTGELPFAGHPTLGTCHAWLAAGGVPKADVIVQECPAGLIRIRRDPPATLLFAAPERQRTGKLADDEVALIAAALGLSGDDIVDHEWCDNGPPWEAMLLASAAQVRAVRPDGAALGGRCVGLVGPTAPGDETQFEVRAFFPTPNGIAEDPVTGSLNAALGQWLIGSGRAPASYVAAQGTCLGRAGRITVRADGDDVWVGGGCVTVVEGTVNV